MRDDVYRVAQRYAQHHGASTYGDGRDFALNSPHTGQRKERTEERWYDDKGYRAAGSKAKEDDRNDDYKGYDTTQRNDLSGYADVGSISGWAMDALRWANKEGLITGRTAVLLAPKGDTTRAETATILMRYLETIA